MAEREYTDYSDWINAGGDPSYGGAVSAPQDTQAPAGMSSEESAEARHPGTPAPEGKIWVLENGEWVLRDVNPSAATPPQQNTSGNGNTTTRHPNAGPDGSTTPNMDPPGYVGGYWRDGQWVQGSPRSTGGSSTGGGGGQGGALDMGGLGQPERRWSDYISPGPFQPRDDTFEFEAYVPGVYTPETYKQPTYGDLEAQPGFLEGQQRLQKQIEAGAAYRGMVRSGMTLGDLWTGLDSNKEQRFAEFDNRQFRNFAANEGNRFNAFAANEGNRYNAWSGNLGASRNKFLDELGIDQFRYNAHAADTDRRNNFNFNRDASDNDALLSQWLEKVRSMTSLARPVE